MRALCYSTYLSAPQTPSFSVKALMFPHNFLNLDHLAALYAHWSYTTATHLLSSQGSQQACCQSRQPSASQSLLCYLDQTRRPSLADTDAVSKTCCNVLGELLSIVLLRNQTSIQGYFISLMHYRVIVSLAKCTFLLIRSEKIRSVCIISYPFHTRGSPALAYNWKHNCCLARFYHTFSFSLTLSCPFSLLFF